MKWVEQAGLVKFDFLGLKTLTVLQKACKLLEKAGRPVDLGHLPLDDKPTYELLTKGDTGGVFQLESTGMREALRKLKPDRFGDIIAMVALYRPGPMDNIETYVNRKHGIEKPDYLHPLAQADPGGDLRRHHLPGAGDADRAGSVRLQPRRSRPPAPRHGQEDQGGDGRARRALRQRRAGEGHRGGPRALHLRAGGEIRGLRLQQEPRRSLRADRLSDRLSQGQPSRRSSLPRR